MKDFIQIHPSDNVQVCLRGEHSGHKMTLCDLSVGEQVIKYGFPIGHVTRDVRRGEYIDHNDIKTNLHGRLDYGAVTLTEAPLPATGSDGTFMGYLRGDGRVGVRNELWIIPTVGCVNGICQQIKNAVEAKGESKRCGIDIRVWEHNFGCSQLSEDHEATRRILRALVHHPNAGGVLVVGLGCENNQPKIFREFCGEVDEERVRFIICQEIEGDEVEVGVRQVEEILTVCAGDKRQPCPLYSLQVGLKCGGSDGFSGITANPLLGRFSDWLTQKHGGVTVLTEVPEMFGAEHLLMARAATPQIKDDIIDLINNFKEYFLSHGEPVGENPSPGNKAGGISTLEEKALGCTQKSGNSAVMGVLQYGERLKDGCRGLHLLCAPGNDLVAATALAAAGCQLVLFTTGRGTPFGCCVPTIKIATNSTLAKVKPHWVDFCAGPLVENETMDTMLPRFVSKVISVASGEMTSSERAGIHGMSIWKNGVTL